ncbi:MAG: YgcG family protein [Candidatus Margulisiibacteriota bacterium]|nr:MAG: hypothetical protein A2X43_03635 [Candidatus Margulisbacteria bacterium GWD2_39_127]OGI02495.1 MAG: hypothetical protein A2X42_07410 [Candidatus Margulisbacteria bacterium GWF2_38_17]OGI10988.1 MAG: hypothetical protein A2X41_01935 [Candidatus Margulisbacteria bacterium GWE2_39_32]PZM83182.1 MAG: YgcG family protein [Candidatus Margulisiibacteriota bacterium]HAR62515.1 methanol dehydrogenase [Candidatus Margulisiibacteriota bacterium]
MKKKILFLLFFVFCGFLSYSSVHAADFPKPEGYVNDYAGVLSPQSKSVLENSLYELSQKTGIEMVVVTVVTTYPSEIFTYANELFADWKIGKKGKDNGLLVLLSQKEKRVQVEVGYGLEGDYPDSRIGEILDTYFLPSFKKGNIEEGIVLGTLSFAALIAHKNNTELTGTTHVVEKRTSRQNSSAFDIISKVFVALLLLALFIKYPELFLLLLLAGGGNSRSGSGGGFGDFGGGFGGFGGGSSGGGGAGRGW